MIAEFSFDDITYRVPIRFRSGPFGPMAGVQFTGSDGTLYQGWSGWNPRTCPEGKVLAAVDAVRTAVDHPYIRVRIIPDSRAADAARAAVASGTCRDHHVIKALAELDAVMQKRDDTAWGVYVAHASMLSVASAWDSWRRYTAEGRAMAAQTTEGHIDVDGRRCYVRQAD